LNGWENRVAEYLFQETKVMINYTQYIKAKRVGVKEMLIIILGIYFLYMEQS